MINICYTKSLDLKEVSARFPPVILPSSSASQLRRNLRLPSRNEEITNLKSILDEYSRIPDLQPSLRVLVTAMMKTQGVGRYVSNLLPFRKLRIIHVHRMDMYIHVPTCIVVQTSHIHWRC